MKKYIYILVISIIIGSCILRHADDTKDLGDNYYFLPDGRMSTICYNTAEDGDNKSGIVLTEPKVVDYDFNENFIIAKSIGVYDNVIGYWIIDKKLTEKEMSKSLDSISFYRILMKKNIDLKLNE